MSRLITFAMFVFLTFAMPLSANCKYQLFNVTANKDVNLGDIVQHISNECGYTVVVKDTFAQEVLKTPLYLVNLKDATVDELLDVVLLENDLNYSVENNVLKISYLFTKTFFVDYIGSDRKGESSTNINLSSKNESNSGSGNESSSMTNINSTDDFLFWSKLQAEIGSILTRPEDSYQNSTPATQDDESQTSQESGILINKEAGLVTVTGTKKQIERVASYIDNLHERLKRQVLIDVHIYSVKLDNSRSTGIDWSQIYALQNFEIASLAMAQQNILSYQVEEGKVTGEPEFGLGAYPRNAVLGDIRGTATVNEVIKFLQTQGDVTSISNPKILTLNNQPALISVGNEYFYKTITSNTTAGDGVTTQSDGEQINSVFAGVLLDVTPEISNDGMITLKINPSLSSTIGTVTSNDGTRNMPPDLTRRQISSVITLNDGEHAVLGGLITSDNGVESNKVPILGDIPILNYAFKREKITKVTEELVIIITPKIVSSGKDVNLKELGYNKLEW